MWLKHYKLNEQEQKLVDMSREEFDKYMMSNYADMFKQRYLEKDQKIILPMNFGFEIGPGWHHVLDSLCSKLKIIQDLTGYVCVFEQIKEKYGGARFYYHTELVDKNKPSLQGDQIVNIIDDLVSMYEEYCDYVCEELGTNIDAEEKVQVGSWYYGMGIEGFKKWTKEAFPESSDARIKAAEEDLEYRKKRREIKEKLYELSDRGIDEISVKLSENPQ